MPDANHDRTVISAKDGHRIHVQVFAPPAEAVGVIQILHGLGEHSERYGRFATAANRAGFAVGIHDHRGHGPEAESLGYFAPRNGWHLLISDALLVHEHLRGLYPDQPITLLGHSMGSFIAEHFTMLHGARLSALLLSASTWPSRIETAVAHWLAMVICWTRGGGNNSPLLDKLGFGKFNKAFEPARTGMDWLSRDPQEVDRYIADPLCGGPYAAGLWRDLTGGLLEIGSDRALNRIPSDLPILITGGDVDPVGGDKGLGKLALHYAQTGHGRLKVKLFPGGRHEMLNEINRDDVTEDWLNWIAENTIT